jgi:cytochrome c oxidase cbb3-type subunit 1
LFVLFISAAVWLVIASVLGLIASIKFHSPDFLAGCSILTYGRVHPAAVNALLYGFAIQAGLGVALWILAKLGDNKLVHPLLMAVGAKIWNLGVLVGLLGILRGNGTGFENLEMPRYGVCILFASYILIAVLAMLTLHERRVRALHPSQWFLLAAIFWFPWIYSTANLLLFKFHVRGVTQNIVAWWYSANLQIVWLGLIGVAAIFYLVPKRLNRPLHSGYLALFAFWTLILFGSWTGIPVSAPVPAWMPSLSAVATLLLIIPVLAILSNVCRTIAGDCVTLKSSPTAPFIQFAMPMLLLATLMNIASVLPCVSAVTNFTWFTVSQSHLQTYGFFAMVMFGAVYHIAPQVTGVEWCKPKMVRVHFWLAAIGIILFALPLAIGGVMQGLKLNDPAVAFVDVAKTSLPFFRISTIGELFIMLGNIVFFLNLVGMATACAKKHCKLSFICDGDDAVGTKIAEVKP